MELKEVSLQDKKELLKKDELSRMINEKGDYGKDGVDVTKINAIKPISPELKALFPTQKEILAEKKSKKK